MEAVLFSRGERGEDLSYATCLSSIVKQTKVFNKPFYAFCFCASTKNLLTLACLMLKKLLTASKAQLVGAPLQLRYRCYFTPRSNHIKNFRMAFVAYLLGAHRLCGIQASKLDCSLAKGTYNGISPF